MNAHTPGPWVWWTSNSWRRLRHDDGGATVDVLMPTTQHIGGQPDIIVSDADMALIAAAPELLAALQLAVKLADKNLVEKYSSRTPECEAAYQVCCTAIAKATGASE